MSFVFQQRNLVLQLLPQQMHDFSDFVSTNGLIDTSLIGGKSTWSNASMFLNPGLIDSSTRLIGKILLSPFLRKG